MAKPSITEKLCRTCQAIKPILCFPHSSYRNSNGEKGFIYQCRDCFNKRRKATRRRPEVQASRKRHRERYKPRRHELTRAYRKTPQGRAARSKWRAQIANASGYVTAKQIEARWAYFGGLCWMCKGQAVGFDHVIPLSKGGSNWPSNLRPACASCNAAKRGKHPSEIIVMRNVDDGEKLTPLSPPPKNLLTILGVPP